MGAQFPHIGEAGCAGRQQHPRAPGRVSSRQSCTAGEPPSYSQGNTQTSFTKHKVHFAFLKLQTSEITFFSFSSCFPSHTAPASSISPAFPEQQPSLETAL